MTSVLPFKNENEIGEGKDVQKENEEVAAKRKEMFDNLLKPGSPGLKLKGDYDRILRNLVSRHSSLSPFPRLLLTATNSCKQGTNQMY